jgi:hypothetical protein
MASERQETSRSGTSGVVFVGCLFIGIAAGLLTENMAVGVMGGLGVGFIALGLMRAITGRW